MYSYWSLGRDAFAVIGERSGNWNRFIQREKERGNLLLASDLFSKFGGLLSDSFHSESLFDRTFHRRVHCWFVFNRNSSNGVWISHRTKKRERLRDTDRGFSNCVGNYYYILYVIHRGFGCSFPWTPCLHFYIL